MLRHKEDWKTLVFLVITTGLLPINWLQPEPNYWLVVFACMMAVSVSTIVHNHNHLRIWKNKWLNYAQDHWLTLFYGFPVFAWIPTHNKNHHKYNNREGDYTITWRFWEANNIGTLLSYPSISSWYQQYPISAFLAKAWRTRKSHFFHYVSQYVVLAAFIGVALFIDWKKALLYIVLPQQVALFSVLMFNYLQHVHADEESEWNHSRNMLSPVMNALLFNNGYHTIHHISPGIHWSKLPEEHAKIHDNIDPQLIERSFWWLMIRSYILGPFIPSIRTKSMRVARMERERGEEPESLPELAAAE